MPHRCHLHLFFPLLLASALAYAQEDDEIEVRANPRNAMLLTCSFDPGDMTPRTAIAQGTIPGERAATIRLEAGKARTMRVQPEEVAECIYPSGHRVRLKVGIDLSPPDSFCGPHPVFLSIWVDKKKRQSRTWFGGSCYDTNGHPDLSFHIAAAASGTVVQACTASKIERKDEFGSIFEGTEPPVCEGLPYSAATAVDAAEYPASGKRVAVGTIRRLVGKAKVCAKVHRALVRHPGLFSYSRERYLFSYPDWSSIDEPTPFPEPFNRAETSVFDIDNDGLPDRLFLREYDTRAWHGVVLAVQRASRRQGTVTYAEAANAWIFPCQLGPKKPSQARCPPFGDDAEAGAILRIPGRKPERLWVRNTYLRPFRYLGTSYLGVWHSEPAGELGAVLKLQPSGRVEQTCVFERVVENF